MIGEIDLFRQIANAIYLIQTETDRAPINGKKYQPKIPLNWNLHNKGVPSPQMQEEFQM